MTSGSRDEIQRHEKEFAVAEVEKDDDVIDSGSRDLLQAMRLTTDRKTSADPLPLHTSGCTKNLDVKATAGCVLNADLDQSPDSSSPSTITDVVRTCCPTVSNKG